MEANLVGHSIKVVDPYRSYLLDCRGSTIMQAQLDELLGRFHIPHAISIRAPEKGEQP